MCPSIICLHAAESNVEIMEQSLSETPFHINHIVDTYLLKMIREQRPLSEQKEYAFQKITSIIEQQPDFIFITCTNYIVLLEQMDLETTIPLLKIDDLLFEQLEEIQVPIKILFTNKQTIEGTMTRLEQRIPSILDIEVIFIPDVFDWYIAGDKIRHDQKVQSILLDLDSPQHVLAVAQLSMAKSAENYSKNSGKQVLSPITSLKNKHNNFFNKNNTHY